MGDKSVYVKGQRSSTSGEDCVSMLVTWPQSWPSNPTWPPKNQDFFPLDTCGTLGGCVNSSRPTATPFLPQHTQTHPTRHDSATSQPRLPPNPPSQKKANRCPRLRRPPGQLIGALPSTSRPAPPTPCCAPSSHPGVGPSLLTDADL